MVTDWFQQLKNACGRVKGPHRTGTGYVVGNGQMITCHHVIGDVRKGGVVKVDLPGQTDMEATVAEIDEEHDSALLTLQVPAGIQALQFAGKCLRQAVWDGYGFPGLLGGVPLPLRGTVMDPSCLDRKKKPALLLFSDQIATKDDVHGFSGSPVVVEGYVVGHLKRIIEDDDDKPAYGYVFASPSEKILSLLNIPPAIDVIDPADPQRICIPSIPQGRLHAMVSFNSLNKAFAQRLIRELGNKGFRTTSDLNELQKCERAVIILSKAYLDSPVSQDDAARIFGAQIPLILVIVDDSLLPADWPRVLSYRFAPGAQPEGPVLEQVLYAVAGQRPPVKSIAAMTPEAPQSDPSKGRALINAGLPELALKYLPESDATLEVRRMRALALAKMRKIDDAIAILEPLNSQGQLDAETAGILAGRYRQLWEQTDEQNYFIASLDTYREAWHKTRNPYPGINAASMLLWDGQVEPSKSIADEILNQLDRSTKDFWNLATIAQAWVLVGDPDQALAFYKKMIAAGPDRYENIATVRRTLRRDLEFLQVEREPFEKLLRLPKVVALVGHDLDRPDRPEPRFPPERESEVRKGIAAKLKALQARYSVSSADAGSDILFLEEMKKRNAYMRVILPCSRGAFVDKYLDDWHWRLRFDQAMDHPGAEVMELNGDPDTMWENFLPQLWNCAETTAKQLDDQPTLLAVWDGNPGFVRDTIHWWHTKGALVEVIRLDQRPSSK
jgi:tetratricopeptide (TPR) repeat protein